MAARAASALVTRSILTMARGTAGLAALAAFAITDTQSWRPSHAHRAANMARIRKHASTHFCNTASDGGEAVNAAKTVWAMSPYLTHCTMGLHCDRTQAPTLASGHSSTIITEPGRKCLSTYASR